MDISWKHLLQLQDALWHCAKHSGGHTNGYKLKSEHFHLTTYSMYSKMRVKLDAQTLSRTTSEALHYYGIQGSTTHVDLIPYHGPLHRHPKCAEFGRISVEEEG